MSAYRVASAQRRRISKSLRLVSGLVEKGNNPPTPKTTTQIWTCEPAETWRPVLKKGKKGVGDN